MSKAPMKMNYNMILWLGYLIKAMMFTTSCAFTFLYFAESFNVSISENWHPFAKILAPIFFAVFGLCVADVGAFYWFNVWVGEVETPMQKTVAGGMTALTGLVAISTTILGMLNSLTELFSITEPVRVAVTVITTILIVLQLVAGYGMTYFSRDAYIKSAITGSFLETFTDDIEAATREALRLRVTTPSQPALPAGSTERPKHVPDPPRLPLQAGRGRTEEPAAANPFHVPPAAQTRPTIQPATKQGQTQEEMMAAMLRGAMEGRSADTVQRTSRAAEPATLTKPNQPPAIPPMRERRIVVKVNGKGVPFTDPVAATAYGNRMAREGNRAEYYEDGVLKQAFEANRPPN